LDDLHWVGIDALDLVLTLVRTAETPLRVIGAYRATDVRLADPLSAALGDLARDGLAAQIDIGALDHQAASNLARALLEDAAQPPLVEQVIAGAGGVPFFLVSCAQWLRTGAASALGAEGVPWDIAQTIRQRMGALPEPAREVLGIAAVAGRDVSRVATCRGLS
jgi:predicted ATPase